MEKRLAKQSDLELAKRMRYVLWIAFVLLVGSYICGPIQDPDLWWHITIGRWMLSFQDIPAVDYWNLFGQGKPWVAYSWSLEILFAWVDQHWQINGLIILKLILAILLSATLFFVYGKIARDYLFGAILGVYATAACYNHFLLRPQSFVWIYFSLLLFFLESARRNKEFSLKYAWGIGLCGCLWANTHLSQIIGLAAAGLWLFDIHKPRSLSLPLKAVAAFVLGTLLTPYGGLEWYILLKKSGHPILFATIAEFKPASILQFTTVFLILSLATLLMFVHRDIKRLAVSHSILIMLLTLGALAVLKFMPFAIIATCFVLAQLWGDAKYKEAVLGPLAEGFLRFEAQVKRIPREGLAFLIFVLAFLNARNVYLRPFSIRITPAEAVKFIQENELPGPILNEFGRGGYLLYTGTDVTGLPKQPVPIDGRTNVTPPEVWKYFIDSLYGASSWHKFVDLTKPATIIWRRESPFASLLLLSPEWCLVYEDPRELEDDRTAVFLKRDKLGEVTHPDALVNCQTATAGQ